MPVPFRFVLNTFILSICVSLSIMLASQPALGADVSESVVKIEVTSNSPDLTMPWQKVGFESRSGSGVIIEGNRILTNAHVISHAVDIQVKRTSGSRTFSAEVAFVGHECDLAVLTVKDSEFFDDAPPVSIGNLPAVEDQVRVYGFPIGGESVSVTSGIVSRIEIGRYSHSNANLLEVQVDAAINPGNSGGPAMTDGEIVGIATQVLEDAENVGYIVPPPIIRHFLVDIEDGTYDGFPNFAPLHETVTNLYLKQHLGLKKNQDGSIVRNVQHALSGWDQFQVDDVMTKIDGKDVGDDDAVPFDGPTGNRIDYMINMKQVGETAEVEVLRKGERKNLRFVLNNEDRLIPEKKYRRKPTYLIYGGLTFQPLTLDYFEVFEETPYTYYALYMQENLRRSDREQYIICSGVLGHDITRGYELFEDDLIIVVNGVVPRNMDHLRMLLESGDSEWVRLETKGGLIAVIHRATAKEAHGPLLERYDIASDRSADLE